MGVLELWRRRRAARSEMRSRASSLGNGAWRRLSLLRLAKRTSSSIQHMMLCLPRTLALDVE